jgi:hypothetical protein
LDHDISVYAFLIDGVTGTHHHAYHFIG